VIRSAFAAFAVSPPGFESIVAAELHGAGVSELREVTGGADFTADRAALYRCNLQLRTASRILVRLAAFRAASFAELERHAKEVSWDAVLSQASRVILRVTCRKSRLYHSDAVAQRIAEAIAIRVPGVVAGRPSADEESEGGTAQLFIVRLEHNRCTISADTSGAHLHRRGYRRAVTEAPLRETLAAGLLLASGWDRAAPLLDPFCGSGTLCIEAALMSRRMAPGRARRFRFMEWPDFNGDLWRSVKAEADEAELPSSPASIQGSDRSEAAIRAATDNAERAGVAGDVVFQRRNATDVEPPAGAGWIVTNPPYGVRLGEREELRRRYSSFGAVLKTRFRGWHLCLLAADPRLCSQIRIPIEELGRTTNGGLRVQVMAGTV
jgi:putative N6-adenine-specific DNA methylase